MRSLLVGLFFVGCSVAPITPAPSPGPLEGLDVESVHGLGFFAEERARSQALVAQALVQRDAGVLPAQTLKRAWALAAEGRNPLNGEACGMPLGAAVARKRWGAALGVTGSVGAHVWCADDGGCQLNVYGRPLDDESTDRFTLNAPLAASGDALGALTSALGQLAPPPPSDGKGGGGLGMLGGSGASQLQEEDKLLMRTWPADRGDRTTSAGARDGYPGVTVGHLQSCLSANETTIDVLFEVAPNGTLGRCEGGEWEDATQARCVCGHLQRLAPAAWMAGKRWGMTLTLDRRDQTTTDRRLVLYGSWSTYLDRHKVEGEKYPRFKPKVEHPSIESWNPGSSRLVTGCFVDAFPEPGKLASRWAVWFDGKGQPTKVLEQKGYAPLPKALADCVARALKTAQAPCPSRAGLWAMADLHISARDPNAPPPSLKDVLKPSP